MTTTPIFDWPLAGEFLDRTNELERLEDWWRSPERMPVNLYGRRRVGKSWLFRRFAHGKPAVPIVAHKLSAGAQLTNFAGRLEPLLGVRPDLPDVASLFRVLFRAARKRKILAVVDEFPWLLPGTETGTDAALSEIHAVIEEERDRSKLKLILCGSLVGQMEALQAERSPLHGRLVPLHLRPLPFREAALFLKSSDPLGCFQSYAIAGGMPRYLHELSGADLRTAVCARMLDRNGPLWDEPRTVLDQELRESKVYFAVLQQLASGDKEINEVAQGARLSTQVTSKYLHVLENMRVVRRRLPLGAGPERRSGLWRLDDPFFRFWFAFVFPYQDELETGLAPGDLYDGEVAPRLGSHVAQVFEDWCRSWVRETYGRTAQKVGAWWGPALHELRRRGERHTEEIDAVGLSRNRVTLVGEAKWQKKPMDVGVLHDLREHKLPALRQAGFTLARQVTVLLMARGGYTRPLQAVAEQDESVVLVDVAARLGDQMVVTTRT